MPIPNNPDSEYEPIVLGGGEDAQADPTAQADKQPSSDPIAFAPGSFGDTVQKHLTPPLPYPKTPADRAAWVAQEAKNAPARDLAVQKDLILRGGDAAQKLADLQAKPGDHDALLSRLGFNPAEVDALKAQDTRQSEVANAQAKAQLEADIPTAAKIPLAAVRGAALGVGSVGTLAASVTGIKELNGLTEAANTIPQAGNQAVVENTTRFLVGLKGTGALFKLGGVLQSGTAAAGTIQMEAAQFLAFDRQAGNLADLIESHPTLSNPITEALSSDPNDGEVWGRLKNSLANLLPAMVIGPMVAGVRGLSKVAWTRAKVGNSAAAKVAAEEMDTHLAEAAADASKADTAVSDTSHETLLVSGARLPEETATKLAEDVRKSLAGEEPLSDAHNYGRIASEADAKLVLDGASRALAPEINAAKGGAVQTRQATQDLADMFGEDPDALFTKFSEDAKNAVELPARLHAAKERIVGLAKEIASETQKFDNGLSDGVQLQNLQGELSAWLPLMTTVRAGAARTTGIGNLLSDPILRKAIIASGGDSKAVVGILTGGPNGLARAIATHNEFWINAILSGVTTHAVNVGANIIKTIAPPMELMIGGTVSGDWGSVAQGLATFNGVGRALKDSVRLASRSFLLEDSILEAGSTKTGDAGRFAISSENLGFGPGMDWLGKAVRLSSRFLTKEDEFFKQINFRADLYARSTREGYEMGLRGTELSQHIEDTFEKGLSNGRGLDPQSLEYAKQATFTNELGPLGQDVQRFLAQHPSLRPIVPFVRTPTNIIKEVADRGTLGVAKKQFYSDVAAGGVRRSAALGRTATSAMFMGAASYMSYEGLLTGRGPKDPDTRKRMMEGGWQPYSVKMGDSWVSYSRIEPWGSLLGIVADMKEAGGHLSDSSLASVAGSLCLAVSNNLTSKTYLKGLSDVLDTISSGDKNKWERLIQSRAASYVGHPRKLASLLTGGHSDDPYIREVRGVWDAMVNQIPGWSDSLPPARDYYGNPVVYPTGMGPDSISPLAVTHAVSDPAKKELARLASVFNTPFSLPSSKLQDGRVDLNNYAGKGKETAYDSLLSARSTFKIGGKTLAEAHEDIVKSDRYSKLHDGTTQYKDSAKRDLLDSVTGRYEHGILMSLIGTPKKPGKFPNLTKDFWNDKTNEVAVKTAGVDGLKPLLGK